MEKYTEYFNKDYNGYFYIGRDYLQLRNGGKAEEAFKRSIKYGDEDDRTLSTRNLVYAHALQGDFREARQCIKQVTQRGLNQSDIKQLETFIYEEQKRQKNWWQRLISKCRK